MKRSTTYIVAVVALAACLPSPVWGAAAAAENEQQWIDVISSDKAPAEKDRACQRLKLIGSAKAVPALAKLLADEQLSHSARLALESMLCPQAGAALCDALASTTGATKAGIIDSLGQRREAKAVEALTKCLADADAAVAAPAAGALGRIAGPDALKALKDAMPKAPAAVKPAVVDAVLFCAYRMRNDGDAKGAAAVYKEIYDAKGPEHVAMAAYSGMILSAGDQAVALVEAGLTGTDRAAQLAAMPMVRMVEGKGATEAFAALLAKVAPELREALVAQLAQRGDVAALPAILAAAKSEDPTLKAAALDALATLGDASAVPLLAEAAAATNAAEQKAARKALARLHRGEVRQAILDCLAKANPAVQAELVRALAARRDAAAAPTLLKMAQGSDQAMQTAALKALAALADEAQAGDLVAILLAAKTDAARAAAGEALTAVAARAKQPQSLAAPVLAALAKADVPGRCSLLAVAGRIGGADALAALRAGVKDDNADIRDAAVRALAEGAGPDAADDLLALARDTKDATHRVLALRGYWRAVAAASDKPGDVRVKMIQAGLALPQRAEERRLGLAELAKVPSAEALKLAESLCAEQALRAEAETACVRIAAALAAGRSPEAKAALTRLAKEAATPAARAEAVKALGEVDQFVGYLMPWLAAGPFRQEGKECAALFDVPFPPEKDVTKTAWKLAPKPADAALAWQVDLLPVAGGDNCVVYIRTRVFSPAKQDVGLQIGSDDGIKLWINGKLVHSNNAMRAVVAGSDKATATLEQGWNDVLAKITQNNMGCGACIRVVTPAGAPVADLRCDPEGK